MKAHNTRRRRLKDERYSFIKWYYGVLVITEIKYLVRFGINLFMRAVRACLRYTLLTFTFLSFIILMVLVGLPLLFILFISYLSQVLSHH